jgi:threonine dehydratase
VTDLPVTLADVEAAADRIRGGVVRTPSAPSLTLSSILGADVVVKFESLQFTASYKERGALHRLLHLDDDERGRGVVAMSAGNHAQGVAHHAARLGVPATIVMPATTPFVKVARTRALGAEVELVGATLEEATARAHALADAPDGPVFIHPFDDPVVIAGQGTVALEMLDDHPDLDVLVVPVGGGGLVSGMAVAAKGRHAGIEVVGVESEVAGSMRAALGRAPADAVSSAAPNAPTIADGIAVRTPGGLTPRIVTALVDDVLPVSERSIERAINLYLEIEKVVAEGAGAAALAALVEHPDRFSGRRVGVVLSGANIDPRLLSSVIIRGLLHDGRLSRLRVEVPDRPGTLSEVTGLIAGGGANIVEVVHQRMYADVPSRLVELEVLVETLDRAHAEAIVDALVAGGYVVDRGTLAR